MSSVWKKTPYTARQLEQKWINLVFETHDQICCCDDPWLHLLYLLNKNGNAIKPLKDIENIKWLLIGKQDTGEDPTDKDGEETGFYDGELEKLFEEPDEKENLEDVGTR